VTLALDAQLETVSPRGRRSIPAAEFFEGLWTTALEPDEVLAGVSFPVWSDRAGFAVEELARRHGDFAIAGAAIGVELDADERIGRCAIGLIGLGSAPERARAAEAELAGRPLAEVDPQELGHLAMSGLDAVPSDLHGSAGYRRRVGAVMVARAWTAAAAEARRG
jgi:carbon-monoxide dehydrogenase medium subunit